MARRTPLSGPHSDDLGNRCAVCAAPNETRETRTDRRSRSADGDRDRSICCCRRPSVVSGAKQGFIFSAVCPSLAPFRSRDIRCRSVHASCDMPTTCQDPASSETCEIPARRQIHPDRIPPCYIYTWEFASVVIHKKGSRWTDDAIRGFGVTTLTGSPLSPGTKG